MKANVDVVKGMRLVTMHVRLEREAEMRFRVWPGCRLIALAAWVMNCNIRLTRDGDE